jgi:RNA recognition motif-containing protein
MLPSRRLYIRDLPEFFSTKDNLVDVFGKYGTLSLCYFTGKDDAVVSYFDMSHAIEAYTHEKKQNLDIVYHPKADEKDDDVDDDTVRVSPKCKKRLSEGAVRSVFERTGRIMKITNDGHRNRNNMYVKYFDIRDAKLTVDNFDGRLVDGLEVVVTKALSKVVKHDPPTAPPSPKKKQDTPPPPVLKRSMTWEQLTRDVLNFTTDVILDDTPAKRKKYAADLQELLKQIEC